MIINRPPGMAEPAAEVLHSPSELWSAPGPALGKVVSVCWNQPGGAAHTLKVYLAHFDSTGFAQRCFGDAGIACPEHIAGAVKKRQAEYFFGRLCAQAALAQRGLPQAQVSSGRMREPIWPAGIVGSITHSRAMAAAVILPAAHCSGIGIDVEEVVDAATSTTMLHSIVSEREYAYLCTLKPAHSLPLLLTLVFSAKESFFKGVFGAVNRYFDFDAIEVERIDLRTQTIHCKVVHGLCREWQPGDQCRIGFLLLDGGQLATAFAW